MEQDPNVIRVRSTSERRREPPIVIAAIAAFLVLAIVKPWSLGASSGAAPTATPRPFTPPKESPALASSPSSSPSSPEDPNLMSCLASDTAQVVLLERWPGNEIRSWIAATDLPASGPFDPRVTRIVVFSSHTIGLGICAPRATDGAVASGARLVDVQLVIKTGGTVMAADLGAPDLITRRSATPDAAILYGTPATAATRLSPDPSPVASSLPASTGALGPGPRSTPWPAGSYAIAFTFSADPSPQVRWLRIDILAPAGPG